MVCFECFAGWTLASVSPGVASFLERIVTEVLTWFRNWGAQALQGVARPDHVIPLPRNNPRSIVGVDDVLKKFHNFLEDKDCEIIGIYGMGGIGKTTLLREINNRLFRTRPRRFELVIFIAVTTDIRVDLVQEAIQNKILERLGLEKESCGPKTTISKALRHKKFLLLLDNLWVKVDFVEIGIPVSPFSRRGSKIVLTTRSSEVCADMGDARWELKMPLLSRESSWELFCQSLKMKEDQWTESTKELAKDVASKCQGLPLALITVGRAMAHVTVSREWEAALKRLRGPTKGIRNMEEEVLRSLKFSYDRLREKRHKECLLYCSLFPEGLNIDVDDLIEYWVGEGLLEEGDDSIDRARVRGFSVITDLKAACLLEEGDNKEREVRLHDVVRQMALWITSGQCEGEENEVFLVKSGERLNRVPEAEKWKNSTRISLMSTSITSLTSTSILQLPERPDCQNLRTLLLFGNRPLSQIQGGFFQYMASLTVLDLSWTGIKLLPPDISLLVELRFLALKYSALEYLPKELGRLTKLRNLNLSCTPFLRIIPREAISSLSRLQSLNTFGAKFEWAEVWNNDGDDGGAVRCVCLNDLAGLPQLDEFGLNITLQSRADLQALLKSDRLCSMIRYLSLKMLESSLPYKLCELFGATKDMRKLEIRYCDPLNELVFPANQLTKLEELSLSFLLVESISWKNGYALVRRPSKGASFKNLIILKIWYCLALKEITWAKELPCLETLSIRGCLQMEEMIVLDELETEGVDQERDSFFPKLRLIYLIEMWSLKSICGKPLLFPALAHINMLHCPKLKKLPFGLDSAKNMVSINGGGRWWNALEWENQDIRSKFIPYFVGDTDVVTD